MQLSEKTSRPRCDSRQGRNPRETGYLNANNRDKLLVAESRALSAPDLFCYRLKDDFPRATIFNRSADDAIKEIA
jgi:hypothetical protein